MGEMKETLKAKYYFDEFGKLKVVGVRMPKEYPRCYGWKKTLRRSPKEF